MPGPARNSARVTPATDKPRTPMPGPIGTKVVSNCGCGHRADWHTGHCFWPKCGCSAVHDVVEVEIDVFPPVMPQRKGVDIGLVKGPKAFGVQKTMQDGA